MDAFLSKVRLAIDEGRCIIDTSKLKNKKTMAALGLRPEDVLRKFLLLPMKIICMDLNRIIVQIIKDRMFGFSRKKLIGL